MSKLNWIWPTITNENEAQNAAKSGAFGAIFVAIWTGGLAIVAIATGRSYGGIDAYGLVDALLFAIIAWRLFRYSFPWAVFGLLLMLAELSWKLSHDPKHFGVITIILALSFAASARGTFFIQKGRKNKKVHANPSTGHLVSQESNAEQGQSRAREGPAPQI